MKKIIKEVMSLLRPLFEVAVFLVTFMLVFFGGVYFLYYCGFYRN